ncbi:MAG: CDP-glycerol glycerophosphotransferase family protein [Dorea sp.]|nr:CDP-glycerol glycerophosphotransferase family protein [Dorea sp.]
MLKQALGRFGRYAVEGNLLLNIRKELDEGLGRISRYFYAHSLKSQPNKVFFHTQEDKYCCNPKYICEEFRRRGLTDEIDIVWRIRKNEREGIPTDCRVVNGGSFEFFKELFTSKYIISNSVLYVKKGFNLRKDQVVFQTWHGSLGFKRFGKNDYKGGWHWVRGAIATGKMTDYCVTNSSFVSDSLRNTYWPKTPMLEYGHPRNDVMFDNYADVRAKVKADFLKQHKLPADTHFFLYGPTFRDSKSFEPYNIDIDGVIEACKKRFGGEWKFLLRYHSALWGVYEAKNQINNKHVINVTDYEDMQLLMTIADIGVTDYSSWLCDFMLQRRPGFIFATDMAAYNNERGLCYPLETTPFPLASNNKQLINNILNFDEEKYLTELEAFLADKGCIEDGHASERVVDKILELMEAEKKKK